MKNEKDSRITQTVVLFLKNNVKYAILNTVYPYFSFSKSARVEKFMQGLKIKLNLSLVSFKFVSRIRNLGTKGGEPQNGTENQH